MQNAKFRPHTHFSIIVCTLYILNNNNNNNNNNNEKKKKKNKKNVAGVNILI